jgi:predicted ATPase
MTATNKENCIILTGAPGSGKTTTLKALGQHDIQVVPEFAREIISKQRAINGNGVYDKDPLLFKELILSRAINSYLHADDNSLTIFDRGIPDLLAYSDCFNLPRGSEVNAAEKYRYCNKVFFTPSWEEIYTTDEERKMSFLEAKAFGDNLKNIYKSLGYELIEPPCLPIEKRIDFILNQLTP